MASPLWKYGGRLNGRISPINAEPQDTASLYYYGGAWYYGYSGGAYVSDYAWTYTYEYGHVFVLGEDSSHYPEYRLQVTDTSYVEQASIDLTGIDIVYFCWRLNTSRSMPRVARVLSSSIIEIKDGGIGAYNDGCLGVVLPKDFTSGFLKTDVDRHLVLAGTDSNDGTYRIAGVPWSTDGLGVVGGLTYGRVATSPAAARHLGPGESDPVPVVQEDLMLYKNGQVAILDATSITAETKSGATATILGHRWVAKAYIDGTLRAELRERPGRWWQRNYMAAHVSKLTGAHTLKFELSVEDITGTAWNGP